VKKRLLQEVFGAADVLSDGVGRVVTAAEPCPFFGTQPSSGVTSTRVCACKLTAHGYVKGQMTLSARRNIIHTTVSTVARVCVRPSVCPTQAGIVSK